MYDEKSLTKTLQELQGFERTKPALEQYSTPPAIVARLLLENKEALEGKTILDLGAGTGILGIAALLLGAKRVTFIEKDSDAVTVLKKNLKHIDKNYDVGKYKIIVEDLALTDETADTTIMNPPFGTRNKNIDTFFLDYAITHSETILTFHKTSTQEHISKHAERLGKHAVQQEDLEFPLEYTMEHHKKPRENIAVTFFVFV